MSKSIKVPNADHPISITPSTSRVVIKVAGRTVVDTVDALVLREASYPPVFYVPRQDTDMSLLVRSELSTYCPYKGDCAYYGIPSGGDKSANAVWTYEQPFEAVTSIKDRLAFYVDRVDAISETPFA